MAQGTIKDWDEETRTGSLLMEDRTEVGIDATSIEGSNIRTLRLGQRVRVRSHPGRRRSDRPDADAGDVRLTVSPAAARRCSAPDPGTPCPG